MGQKTYDKTNNNQNTDDVIIANSTDFALQVLNDEILRLQSKNKKVFVFFSPTKNSLLNNQTKLNENLKKKVLKNTLNLYDMSRR